MKLEELAAMMAVTAHAAVDHRRKYTFEPYDVHLREVAEIVKQYDHDENMIAAAWLHDVVEDTAVTVELVSLYTNHTVASYVEWLTNQPVKGNRRQRKEAARKRLESAPRQVHTIKCADIISNVPSITKHDIDFAKVYVEEKALMLDCLHRADPAILARAKKVVKDCEQQLQESK